MNDTLEFIKVHKWTTLDNKIKRCPYSYKGNRYGSAYCLIGDCMYYPQLKCSIFRKFIDSL